MARPLSRVVETELFVKETLTGRYFEKNFLPEGSRLILAGECHQCPPDSPIDINFYPLFKCIEHGAPRYMIARGGSPHKPFDEAAIEEFIKSEQAKSEQN